jgi:hypothetical protein
VTATELLAAANATPDWDEYRRLLTEAQQAVLAEREATR